MTEDVVDHVIQRYDKLAESWRKEANRRRELDPNDIIANTFDRCAAEQESLGTMLHEDMDLISVEEYAELHRVQPVTVRRWCYSGQLPYLMDERGIKIKRHARREPETRGD